MHAGGRARIQDSKETQQTRRHQEPSRAREALGETTVYLVYGENGSSLLQRAERVATLQPNGSEAHDHEHCWTRQGCDGRPRGACRTDAAAIAADDAGGDGPYNIYYFGILLSLYIPAYAIIIAANYVHTRRRVPPRARRVLAVPRRPAGRGAQHAGARTTAAAALRRRLPCMMIGGRRYGVARRRRRGSTACRAGAATGTCTRHDLVNEGLACAGSPRREARGKCRLLGRMVLMMLFVAWAIDVCRIGEAANPGPLPVTTFDDQDGDADWDDVHDSQHGHSAHLPFDEPPADVVCPFAEPPSADPVGTQGHDSAMHDADISTCSHRRDGHDADGHHGESRGLRERGADGRYFLPATTFHGAVDGWVFKLGGAGLGYYREHGAVTIRLAEHCPRPPPRRVILLADALGIAEGDARRRDTCGYGHDRRYCDAINARLDDAVGIAATRRRPRATPRRRPPRRRRRRALPAAAPPPVVVADFAADSTWHRDNGLWAIDTANPNSWDGAKRYIEASAADVVAIQEIKLREGEPILTAQGVARRMGWQLSVEKCQVTDCGYSSAGVGIAVRSHLGMSAPPISLDDERLTHRAHVRWIGTICKGGVYVVTVYLWNGEHLSERNLGILEALAATLATCKTLWIVTADFQVPPAELLRSGWPELVGGGGGCTRRGYLPGQHHRLLRGVASAGARGPFRGGGAR